MRGKRGNGKRGKEGTEREVSGECKDESELRSEQGVCIPGPATGSSDRH